MENIQVFGCILEKLSEIHFLVFCNILINSMEYVLFTIFSSSKHIYNKKGKNFVYKKNCVRGLAVSQQPIVVSFFNDCTIS